MTIHRDTKFIVYWIRHAECKINRNEDVVRGRSEKSKISGDGIKQAKRLAERFLKEKVNFTQVYSSPFIRSLDTAKIVCNKIGYNVDNIKIAQDLVELSQGDWERKKRNEVYTIDNLKYINTKGYLFIPPGGESQRMVERRVSNWFEDEILYNKEYLNKESTFVIFSHGLAIKCFLHYVMHFDDRLIYRIRLDNTSITKLVFTHEGWFLESINDVAHL